MLERFVNKVRAWMSSGAAPAVVKTPRILQKSEHRIDPALVSWEAKRTCEALQRRGFKAFIVGGAVRDLLLGVTPKDFDVATDATPEEVKRCQRRAVIIGRRFRLVHVIFGREIIECSTFRALESAGQRKDASGRVISDNVFGEMWEDAARRDFTINALYYDPSTEELYDYHHGFEDIAKKRVRMIGEPQARYREDPVRMLRAGRIAGKLGFSIEPVTAQPIKAMAPLLKNVPAARLVDELLKVLTCGHALECMALLRRYGLHQMLMPVLDVILSEPDGERFLMLALKRTDERLAIGKKISPFFLFATLLWPQVRKRWVFNEDKRGLSRLAALHEAAVEVLETQSHQLSIQRRYQADMHDVWLLQGRLERRTGKSPFSVAQHPRYRAAYDFLLLRSQSGEVPESLPQWWDSFASGDEETRHALIDAAQLEAREAGSRSRSRTPRDGFAGEADGVPKKRRRPRRRRKPSGKDAQEPQS